MTDTTKQLVLLEFELEKEIDPILLNRLASQVCWSLDKVARCEHVSLDRVHFVVQGQAPDALYATTVQQALGVATRSPWWKRLFGK